MMNRLRRILEDAGRVDLLPVKMVMFLQAGSLTLLFPFLPLHMKEMGFTISQVSLTYGLISLNDILLPLLLGSLLFHIKTIRYLLVVFTLVSAGASLLLASFSSQGGGDDFIFYLLARLLLEMSRSCLLNLSESTVAMTLKIRGGDYGIQKTFGTLGALVVGPLSGYILDSDFAPVFHVYAVIQLLTGLLFLTSNLHFGASSKESYHRSGVRSILGKPLQVEYLVASCSLGTLWGFMEAFLFIHIESMGYSRRDIGWTLSLCTVLGVLVAIFSGAVLERSEGWRLGLSLCFISYSLRLLGYSLLGVKGSGDGRWILLLLEMMKPVGHPLAMITTGSFIKEIISTQDIPSFESLFSCAYFGVGKSLGSVGGGWLIGYCGISAGMQLLSLVAAAISCYLSLPLILFARTTEKNN